MRNFTRTCLIICTCCIIALRAITVRDDKPTEDDKEPDDFDFDFDHFIDVGDDDDDDDDEEEEAKELASLEKEGTRTRALEPDAEMLPAHYKGVKPPGVDHMEMTRPKRDKLLSGKKVFDAPGQLSADYARAFHGLKYGSTEV